MSPRERAFDRGGLHDRECARHELGEPIEYRILDRDRVGLAVDRIEAVAELAATTELITAWFRFAAPPQAPPDPQDVCVAATRAGSQRLAG